MTLPRARFVALSAAALLIPHFADAQLTSRIEAGGLITDASGQAAIPGNIWRVAPAAGLRGSLGSLSVTSSAWLENQNWQLVDGTIGGTLVAPTIYGVRAELIGNASRAYDDRALGADQVDVGTRINFLFNRTSGAWVGGGVARPWRVAVVSTMDLLNAGAWMDVGRARFTATGTTFSLTKIGANDELSGVTCPASSTSASIGLAEPGAAAALVSEGSCRSQSRVTDFTLAGRWNLDRFELAGEAGHRVGELADVASDSRYWSSGTVTLWVAPRAAFVMGGGRQPSNPARGIPARSFGTFGLMLAYAPTKYSVPVTEMNIARIAAFETKPAADGMQKITVRVARVESVDVMGDFSDWSPLTMVRRGRDLWELTVPLTPGRHQINIRTDGGKWVAPPGLPKINDGFSGEVGVLIVK
ncbi:MAG TPA: glycogen-binding domain-containing protein [Gemmatimonadaceae bacterium]|nr:glycogen-binding domain-containing protein [Gemmatimonadaceae bacterium]